MRSLNQIPSECPECEIVEPRHHVDCSLSPWNDPRMEESLERVHGRVVVANVSGGKDSTALSLHLTDLGIPHRRVFADTGWEHADTYRYLDRVEKVIGPIDRVQPLLGMRDLIRKKGMFPGRLHRYCTSELKVKPINAFMDLIDPNYEAVVCLGLRAEESAKRAALPEWELGGAGIDRLTWRPIIGWTLAHVIAIHKRHGIEPNPLYLRGASRVGCWPCIHSRKSEIRMVASETPERIEEIADLERELKSRRLVKMATDPEYAAKAIEKKFRDPTFFSTRQGAQPIRKIVDWSKTSHGGKQIDLLGPDPDAGCMRWGLCEHDETNEAHS